MGNNIDDIRLELEKLKEDIEAFKQYESNNARINELYKRCELLEDKIRHIDTGSEPTKSCNNQESTHIVYKYTQRENSKARLSEQYIGKYIVGILASVLILFGIGAIITGFWNLVENLNNLAKVAIIQSFCMLVTILMVTIIKRIESRIPKNGFVTALSGCINAATIVAVLYSSNIISNEYPAIALTMSLAWFIAELSIGNILKSWVYYIIGYICAIVILFNMMSFMYISSDVSSITSVSILLWVAVSEISVRMSKYDKITIVNRCSLVFIILTNIILVINTNSNDTIALISIVLAIYSVYKVIHTTNNSKAAQVVSYLLVCFTSAVFMIISIGRFLDLQSFYIENLEVNRIITVIVIAGIAILSRDTGKIFLKYCYPIFTFTLLNSINTPIINYMTIISLMTTFILAKNIVRQLKISKSSHIIATMSYIILVINYVNSYNFSGLGEQIGTISLLLLGISLMYINTTAISNYSFDRDILNIFYIMLLIPTLSNVTYNELTDYYLGILVVTILFVANRIYNLKVIHSSGSIKSGINIIRCIIYSFLHASLLFYWILVGNLSSSIPQNVIAVLGIAILPLGSFVEVIYSKHSIRILLGLLSINLSLYTACDILNIPNFIISVFGLLCAVGIIFIGFKCKKKPMRLEALAIMFVYIAKIILFDTYGIDNIWVKSMLFIFGGALCFIVSYLYNVLDKHVSVKNDL